MTEPTDAELDELRQANSGRLNFVTLSEFRTIARAVLARWGQPAHSGEPLTDEWIRSRCKEPWVFDTAKQWVRMAEAAHGINKGDQHGAE